MKAFRRVLAMLAVIAIAVSGFAFAEEPALVAALSEVVIEEIAQESIETAEEPAAEEAAVEAAVELPEEPAAEEEAEEPAAEAIEVIAEADSEESDMPETIDVPVVMSLLHRDEVPGDCPHTNERVTYEYRWNTEVVSFTAKEHTIRYTGEDEFYCPDCGYEYYLPFDEYRETSESHSWSWDGTYCYTCNYTNSCAHANMELTETNVYDTTLVSSDAKTHTVTGRVTEYYHCNDCDLDKRVSLDGYQTVTQDHEWNWEGVCYTCDYKNSCAHANAMVMNESRANVEISSIAADTHTISYNKHTMLDCRDCGFEGWVTGTETLTITEAHNWYEGKCHVCEAQNSCRHSNAKLEDYVGRYDSKVVSTTTKDHTLSYIEVFNYNCPDCGEGYREYGTEPVVITEEHSWYDGRCYACNGVNSCKHENRIFNYSDSAADEVISYDNAQHTCVYVNRSYYDCQDCGEYFHEDSGEGNTVTEAHRWWNDRCEVCPARNSCPHANEIISSTDENVVEVLSSDASSHTISYRENLLYTCMDCGNEHWFRSEEIQTKTADHEWDDGECWVCKYENNCTHKNAVAEPGVGKKNIKVLSSNAQGHTISYNEVHWYDCPDCGENYRVDGTETITVTEGHDWWNGRCDACNTVNPCAHANRIFTGTTPIARSVISFDEKEHTCVFFDRTHYECPDCGEYFFEDGAETYTATQSHNWWNGSCEFCPAVNSCAHENIFTDYVNKAVFEVLNTTSSAHTIKYREERRLICPDCGEESWQMQDEIKTVTEDHDWWNGKCGLCDKVNTCAHKHTTEGSSYPTTVKVISTTDKTHVLEVHDTVYSECNDCGESIRKQKDNTYTLTASHGWDNNGVCYECSYRSVCSHSRSTVSVEYYSTEFGVAVDANTHTTTYRLVEITVCDDCGYRSEKTLSVEKRLENHDIYDKGVCRICGYQTGCAHKNTSTRETRRFIKSEPNNSKTHNFTYNTCITTTCNDCGADISYKVSGTKTESEPHYFDYANICQSCNYQSSCAHANKEKKGGSDKYVESYSTEQHIIIEYDITFYLCASCGCELTNLMSYKVVDTDLKKHSFKNGQCTECGLYEVECVHEYDKNGKCKLCGKMQNVEPESITLVKKLQLSEGEEYQLEPSLNPSNASAELKYSSSKSSVVSVSKDGLLSAKKAGEATITVRSGDVEASCVVTVVKAPTAIELNRSKLVLRLNGSAQLTASIKPGDASADVLWTSSSPDIVSVDQEGCVTAKKYGSAVITVSSELKPDVKASCTVEVSDAVSDLDIGAEAITLAVKQDYQLKPAMVPEQSGVEFSYSSSDSKVASVSRNGKISALKTGSAVITVSSDTGAEKSLTVTVKKAPSKVTISETKKNVGVGDSFQLSATIAEDCHADLTWSSSNSKLASVDENGFVTTLKDGKATITVKTHNGKSAKCTLTIMKAPTSIRLNKDALALSVGETAKLTATITKDSASVISWSCSGDAVTVADGVVTAVKEGSATVTATTGNGLSASCAVSVLPAPTHIVLNAEELRLSVKQTFTLEAKLMAGEAEAAGKISFSSSNTKAATVSADGVITAKKAGETTITVTAANGVSAACELTVYAAPTKVSLNAKSAELGVGDTFELIPGYKSEEALTSFTYSNSNSKVVSIEQSGDNCIVTALKAGKANITIKTHNGKSAKCAITVKASPESISLNAAELALGEGQSAELSVSMPKNTAAQIIWSSSSGAVTVENGIVTAVKAGTATITAATKNGLASASCVVTINPAPTAVIAEDVMLVVGQKYTATAMLQAGDVSYEGACSVKLASGKGIVTVNEKTGLITAKKAGTAVVTLTAYNGVSADCTITVVAAPKSVKLSASKKTLAEGESFELTATLSPANAYTDGYTVTMDKEGIVSVDGEDGSYTVTAIAAGKVKLTIAASNGKKASCTVTVK